MKSRYILVYMVVICFSIAATKVESVPQCHRVSIFQDGGYVSTLYASETCDNAPKTITVDRIVAKSGSFTVPEGAEIWVISGSGVHSILHPAVPKTPVHNNIGITCYDPLGSPKACEVIHH